MENEEYKDAMKKLGQDIVFKTGGEYKAIIQQDYQRFGEIIRALGKK